MAEDWTSAEIAAAIDAYFDMLQRQLANEKVVKAHVYRQLEVEGERTAKSFEFKMQNISAVLALNDLPFLRGLAPAKNFQHALEDEVLKRLDLQPDLRAALITYGGIRTIQERLNDYLDNADDLVAEPPPVYGAKESERTFAARKIDFAVREAACRQLGLDGELFVVAHEMHRLTLAGRSDLANEVDHVSRTRGDGLGYDIRSFTPQDQELFIEVKTTNFDRETAFLITDNELAFSKKNPVPYRLYRLFEFNQKPRLFVLSGSMEDVCLLSATRYRAWPK